MLCDDLEGWDREDGREAQEGGDMGTYVCIWLIHFGEQQKRIQYCEAIILQKRSIKQKRNLNFLTKDSMKKMNRQVPDLRKYS